MTPVAASLHTLTFLLSALMGLSAWFVYVWAVKSGQFKDVEEAAEAVVAAEDRD